MKPSSSPSDGLFGPLSGAGAAAARVGDLAWLQAMLDVEAALATAGARAGLVPPGAAAAIAARCTAGEFDAAGLGRRAVASGNPVVPLVRDLAARVPADAAPYVHAGATSQDVLDTAASLVARRALEPILADLAGAAGTCARLAGIHRDTLLPARTLLQQALPTTFGLKCAGWLVSLDEARAGLARVRDARLAVQLGGAAGTAASLGEDGVTVARLLAGELQLAEPVLPWHTDRTRFAELAGALGVAAGVLGKIAADVLLLAQTEVAEVSEAAGPGRGGSSTLPHKQNPVGAVLVSAGVRRVPGLVATVLAGMAQEHERGAGGWHAEWETLTELLRLVGGAAAGARDLLPGLRVDAARMRADLDLTGGLLMAESVAGRLAVALGRTGAHEVVARACRRAVAGRRPLRDALLDEPAVREHLPADELDAALDPASYLGSAGRFIDRALAAHRTAETAGRPGDRRSARSPDAPPGPADLSPDAPDRATARPGGP